MTSITFILIMESKIMPWYIHIFEGPGGSMSCVIGLPNISYKPITNTAWVRTQLCKLQKRVH